MKVNDRCTGCMACYNICPFEAIEIIQNEKGFYEPNIIEEKCKKCNKCKNICPEINKVEKNKIQKVYASWNKNKEIREKSTSGGIFTSLAENILEQKGVVFGAIFNEKFEVVHSYIEKKEDLYKFRGSKYVQSNIGSNFKKVREFLKDGRKVLFSGTACQIAGLMKYLGEEYPNLLTVDVLCHGVPSPKIFKEYINDTNKNNKEITDIKFRYKKPSWTKFSMKIYYKDEVTYIKNTFKDPYLRGFLEDYITNEICASCNYVGEQRGSDITLADFWGYISECYKTRNNEKGISLILVNTDKGNRILENIKEKIEIHEKSFIEAARGNRCLSKPYEKNKLYKEFWEDYFKKGYKYSSLKYFKPRRQKLKRKISLLFNNKAYLIPKIVRKKLIEVRETSKK